jgi:small subunit ribosomal protein S1
MKMSEIIETTENFEEMLNAYENEQKRQKIKNAMIVSMDEGTVFVDIGKKVEGVLPKSEIIDENGEVKFKVGDEIPVMFTKRKTSKGEIILSHKKALNELKRKEFLDKFNVGDEVEVKITALNKGGFVTENKDGIEFFIPKSESALKLNEDNIGKTVKAKIIEIKKNSIVISRKQFLNEKKEERKKFIESIKDEIIKAKIKTLKKDGIVIEFESGWTGFVPKDEVSYKKESHFKLFKKDDEVEVKLIDADKMLFSIKATQINPWAEVKENNITKGDVLKVTVTNIREYGAFVDIGNGVEGFLHISEISWNSNSKIEDLLKVGDEIDVEVTDLDLENKRLRVSYKSLLPKPAEVFIENHKEGDIVEGKVVNLTDIGGFIEVDNIVCFLPNRFVSWTKGEKAKDILSEDENYKFKVISIDIDNNKIILSKKDAEDSPYVAFAKEYSLGDLVKGKIKNIADFGIFVSFNNGVEALIRKNDLEKDINEYNIGDEVEGHIIEMDVENKRVKLSQK